ncbi:hypothetical protein M426DRAFT_258284 [Hypoxylon sp. CI-4A]|nr:hypothetical protein M426DRAFT_258284 [Hypoxylon sp. CI-4A]
MERRYQSYVRPGGQQRPSTHQGNIASTQPNAGDISIHSTKRVNTPVKPPIHRIRSNSDGAGFVSVTPDKVFRPATSSSSKRQQAEAEAWARARQRAEIYNSLFGDGNNASESSDEEDIDEPEPEPEPQQNPVSSTPSPTTSVRSQPSFRVWTPKKPIYVHSNSSWEKLNAQPNTSKYKPYRPPPPPTEAERPKPTPLQPSHSDLIPAPLDLSRAWMAAESREEPTHTHTIPSTSPLLQKRGRRLPHPSSPVTPSPVHSSPVPPTPASPVPRSIREPSPARGAWASDHPRQERGSFVERAIEDMSERVRRSLHKTRFRRSSFDVIRVVKRPVEDVVGNTSASGPAATDENETRGRTMRKEGEGEDHDRRRRDSTSLEMRYNRHLERSGGGFSFERSDDAGELDGGTRRRVMQVGQQQQQQQQETSSTNGRDWVSVRVPDPDPLDDLKIPSPNRESFFVSEWSRQQVIRQAQEAVASLPPSLSYHSGQFGANAYQSSTHAVLPEVPPPPLPPPPPPDARMRLPSQTGSTSSRSTVFCESPQPMTPVHSLKRQNASRRLRR